MVTYPNDWKQTQLKELGRIQMCRRVFQEQTKAYGAIPFYKISTFGKKADAFISQELYDKYKSMYPYPEKDDILLSAAGTIGRTVVFDGKDAYFQDSNIVWLNVDKTQIDRAFLWWFYRSYPWNALEGTTIQRLYNNIILNTNIALPPLPEQEKITKTLSCFDTYLDDLAELIEKKKAIRDGALEDLVSGRTQLDGNRIDWKSAELKQIAFLRKGRSSSSKKRYISTENMSQNFAGIVPYSGSNFVDGCAFYKTDTLIANIRPYLKKIWYASFDGACSADVLILSGNDIVVPKLLFYILANDGFINYVMSGGIKGIKMPRGDKKYIMNYQVLYPADKHIQQVIADTLTAMDAEIADLEAEREKMIQIREGAMDDLLTGRIRLKA